MCVILLKPKGVGVSKNRLMDWLDAAMERNRDGFGVYQDGKIFKTTDALEFRNEIKGRKIRRDSLFAIHCRIRTNGSIRHGNCHPFVNGRFVLFHNGVQIGSPPPSGADMTDSEFWMLSDLIPAYREKRIWELAQMVSHESERNRILLIDRNRNEILIKAGEWLERNGVFYSNGHSGFIGEKGGVKWVAGKSSSLIGIGRMPFAIGRQPLWSEWDWEEK